MVGKFHVQTVPCKGLSLAGRWPIVKPVPGTVRHRNILKATARLIGALKPQDRKTRKETAMSMESQCMVFRTH